MKFIGSLIVVEDIQKSRFLYETLLKQKVKTDFGENITFHGDFSIHQKEHFRTLINNLPVTAGSNNLEIIVKVLKENGLEFIHEIREQPWKQQVLRFYDYDRHIVEIGERMEHVAYRLFKENYSIEEISKITYLPVEIVKKSIEEYSK